MGEMTLSTAEILHADGAFGQCARIQVAEMNYLLENKASRLGVRSSDPGALNAEWMRIAFGFRKSYGTYDGNRIATQSNKVSWTVAAAAGLEWARKSFQMLQTMKSS